MSRSCLSQGHSLPQILSGSGSLKNCFSTMPKHKNLSGQAQIQALQSDYDLLPRTDAVRVQLYRMANSPNVVHTAIDVSSLLCWNTSSFPSVDIKQGQSIVFLQPHLGHRWKDRRQTSAADKIEWKLSFIRFIRCQTRGYGSFLPLSHSLCYSGCHH